MKRTILLPQDIAEPGKKYLRERGYELKMGRGISEEVIAEDVKGCSGIIARLGTFSKRVMEAEPELNVIARHGAGYDNIDIEEAKKRGIWVTFDPVSNANAVAEHCLGLILGCAKHLTLMDRAVRKGEFQRRNELLSCELSGKVLGIAGFGRIGRMVAEKARNGFGMEILVFDPYVKELPYGIRQAETLEELLEAADFVSAHMPLTKETRGMFGRKEFLKMKQTAWFVNGARGPLVKEEELIMALRERVIAGAALDVFAAEPPAADSGLFEFENVILSPHNAALTEEAMDRMSLTAAKAADDVLSGRRAEYVAVEGKWIEHI